MCLPVVVVVSAELPHSGSKWLKPAKNKFTGSLDVISRVSPSKFQQIQIISVSGYSLSLIFKICQAVAGINIIDLFHERFNLIFGGFLIFVPIVCQAKAEARGR